MTKRSKRKAAVAATRYRHPRTGETVVVADGNQDAELMCLEQSGRYAADLGDGGKMAAVLERMRELTAQSRQNRARIVKRLFGSDGVPPVTTRRSA